MKHHLYLYSFLLILTSSCTQYYQIGNFEETTFNHQQVAIIPFEIFIYGKITEEVSEEEIIKMENYESELFQLLFYNQLLESTKKRKKSLRVHIQDPQLTIEILNKNDISNRSSWEEDPEKLAEILGVDAVLKAKVSKAQFFSNDKSFAIDAGMTLLDIIIAATVGGGNPFYVDSSNKEIFVTYDLFDAKDGEILWSTNYDYALNWSQQIDKMIDRINLRSSKIFPYRYSD